MALIMTGMVRGEKGVALQAMRMKMADEWREHEMPYAARSDLRRKQ